MLRDLLRSALERHGFEAAAAGSPAEAMQAFQMLDPDAVVMDIDLGPGPDGFELAEAMLEIETGAAIVFLTNIPDPRFAGRSGNLPPGIAYLNKRAVTDVDFLVRTLEAALAGAVDTSMRHDCDPNRPFARLTAKQTEVLRLVALGKSNTQIAQLRGTTESAVQRTVARVLDALGIDAGADGNVRVSTARRYFDAAGRPLPVDEVPEA